MTVFVAGATGVLGRVLVPRLVARGHEVVGMTRSASKQDLVRSLGARPVVAHALDPDAVAQAVAAAEPEMIVHQLTALSGKLSVRDMRRPDRSVAVTMTNRLRTEGTDHLVAAGRAVGAQRLVAQSIAAFRFARTGGPGADRGRSPRSPPAGDGIWSHIHIEDAAAATAVAVERGRPGVYNVVDDDPAPVREWLPALASALDAKPPRRVPRWLARLAAGEPATAMMTEAKGSSNAKAKRELGWKPAYASWRHGFAQGLG